MANKSALRAAGKASKADKEDREYRKRVKYKVLKPGWDQKAKKAVPRNFTILSPIEFGAEVSVHKVKGTKSLKVPALCPMVHKPGAKDCEYCESEGDFGPNYAKVSKMFLVYCHDFEGEVFRADDGTRYPWNPLRIVILNQGRDNSIWEVLDEALDRKIFNKCTLQMTNVPKKGLKLRILTKEKKRNLGNKGRVPSEAREEIGEYDFDEHLAHLLNCMKEVDWEYWDVEQPVVEAKEAVDEEEEEGTSYSDDDDDDDDTPVKKSKKSSKSRIARKRDEEEDEDEDTDDESDEEDEDEEPKKKSKKKVVKSKSKKKAVDEDEEDEDDDDIPGDDTDEDDEDEDEEPKKKSKKKVVKSKSKKKVVEDEDDEDEDEDEEPAKKPSKKSKSRR